ncbi:MAG: T9SS type A sorting domain-containing protein [Bacteroidia bacterium]|nr:T9SS type A sorting domain-containing protein [Bacteroidia bacterium]
MKKIILSLAIALFLLCINSNSIYAQGGICTDIVVNGDFSGGNTNFTCGLPLETGTCNSGTYIVANSLFAKCTTVPWPLIYDHTLGTAAGSYLIVDGDPTSPFDVWGQNVTVCANTNYTFSFWAYSLYTNPFTLDFSVNGIVAGSANPNVVGWNQYSIPWFSGMTSGSVPIKLRCTTGGSYRDFGIDDIEFGYCLNTTVNSATVCPGTCATLIGGGGASTFLWSTGVTAPSILVCPGVTTTYTVTGQDACLIYQPAIATVTALPVPTITVPASSTYCVGNSVPPSAFTSSIGGTTYTWTNSNTSIGLGASGSGNVPGFTATNAGSTPISGMITVTPTAGGCVGLPVTYTITVNPISTVNSISNIIQCAGTTITAPAFGSSTPGATFTWTNSNPAIGLSASGSGNLPAFTATNGTASPISGVITVTPSLGGCSGIPLTFTITVNPSPTVTITPATSTIVLGSGATLTASGAASYTWSTGSTSNPITVYPTGTTTYTVTGTNQNGCSSTATATVSIINNPCQVVIPSVTATLSGGIIPNGATSLSLFGPGTVSVSGNFKIEGTFTVNTNLVFVGSNIMMAPSGTTVPNIQVAGASPATPVLTLTQQTHIYSCANMWDGIYVHTNGKIITSGETIIEDAIQAISISQTASLPSTVTNTIFTKILFAIKLSINTAAASPVTVQNSIFTSRQLIYPSTSVSTNPTVASLKTALAATSPSLFISLLRAPYSGQKSFAGIYATDVNLMSIGNSSSPTIANLFDGLMTGIKIVNPTRNTTTATIYNNGFQFILGPNGIFACPMPPAICPFNNGYAIDATGTNNTALNSITVGGTTAQRNVFRNIYGAINVLNYRSVTVQRNNITNVSTGPFSSTVRNYGNGGVIVAPAQNSTILIGDQVVINNCETGIAINKVGAAQLNVSSLQIINNGTSPTLPGVTAALPGYCTNGILVNDAAGVSVAPSLWTISNNFVTEATNCISLTNVKNPSISTVQYNVFSNSCKVRYAVSPTNTNGIKTSGCVGVSLIQNHTNYNVNTAYLAGGNLFAYGIYILNSTNMAVKCNLIERAARGLVFNGACSSPTSFGFGVGITQNTMRYAQDGFVLLVGSPSTTIGTQGSSTSPSNNYWDIPSPVTTQIRSFSATPLTMWGTTPSLPAASTTPPTIVGLVTVSSTTVSTAACGAVPLRLAIDDDSKETSITTENESLLVYPNPNNGTFSLETNSADVKDVFVYDMLGNIVFSQSKTATQLLTVDVSNLPNGIYLVKVMCGDKIQTKKIIKE